jgi:membrane associated rhomboid family serine protease
MNNKDDNIIYIDRKKLKKSARKDKAPKPPKEPFLKTGNIPPFTKTMLAAFIAIQLILGFALSPPQVWNVYATFGFTPAVFTGAQAMPSALTWLSPITHVFVHGGWLHVTFNVIMMMAFGIFTERVFGAKRTAILFFACAIFGLLAYLALEPASDFPLIGASGGISGLFGIGIMLMHQQNALGPMSRLAGKYGPWPLVIFWVILMFLTGAFGAEGQAWQAHIAGFLAGVALFYLIQKRILKF